VVTDHARRVLDALGAVARDVVDRLAVDQLVRHEAGRANRRQDRQAGDRGPHAPVAHH
jgi:hypothetical protein